MPLADGWLGLTLIPGGPPAAAALKDEVLRVERMGLSPLRMTDVPGQIAAVGPGPVVAAARHTGPIRTVADHTVFVIGLRDGRLARLAPPLRFDDHTLQVLAVGDDPVRLVTDELSPKGQGRHVVVREAQGEWTVVPPPLRFPAHAGVAAAIRDDQIWVAVVKERIRLFRLQEDFNEATWTPAE